ncbi:MAG: hypothetical protein LCH46_16015 [Proteobacteria bacterium]|nr:hypothetical protein [Pseudomonadota bacterium]
MRKLLLLLALTVGGCASTVPEYGISPQMAELVQERNATKCEQLGAAKGSPGYADCMLKLEEFARQDAAAGAQASAKMREERQKQWEALAQGLNDLSRATTPKTTRTSCRSNGSYGSGYSTNCTSTSYGY